MTKGKGMVKFIALMLSLVLLLALAGCGSVKEDSSNTTATTVTQAETTVTQELPLYTIKFLVPAGDSFNSAESEVGKIIKDKLNIVIEMEGYSGDYKEKTDIMLASGDYPEVVNLQDNTSVLKYIKAGAAIPLDDLFNEYGKNFVETHKSMIPLWKMTSPDGKIYKWEGSVPQNVEMNSVQMDMVVRSDALEVMGWPKLDSEQAWVDFFAGALQKLPTTDGKKTVGVTWSMGESWGPFVASVYFENGKYTQSGGPNGVIFDNEADQYVDYLSVAGVKESIRFWNKVHLAGALDREAFTDKYDNTIAKLNEGSTICANYFSWAAGAANGALKAAGKTNRDYIVLPFRLDSQVRENQARYVSVLTSRPFESMVITNKCKNPERIIQLLDFIATDEGQALCGWGIEGKTYNIENGKKVATQEFFDKVSTDTVYYENLGIGPIWRVWGLRLDIDPKSGQNNLYSFDVKFMNAAMSARQKEVLAKYGWENLSDPWFKDVPYEVKTFDTGLSGTTSVVPSSDEGKIESKCTELRNNYTSKLIMSKNEADFEKNWESLLKEHNALNPNLFVDKYNAIYSENKAKYNSLKVD